MSTNRNIHLYIIWIRTPGKFKLSFLDLMTGGQNTCKLQINKNVISGKSSNHNSNYVCTCCFYKTHLGSYTEPSCHLVHYSLMIWSHIGTKEVHDSIFKTIFSMEPSNKANTVCVQLVRPCTSSERFFPQNGKDNKPSFTTTLSKNQTKDTKPTW